MTAEEVRAFCERYARIWERGDIAALLACYADDCEVVGPIFNVLSGKSQLEASLRQFFRTFSDYMIEVSDVVVDGARPNRAALLFAAYGVHTGDIFGVAGTGRRFEIRGALFFTFELGRIARETRIYDFTDMLIQVGVLKARAF